MGWQNKWLTEFPGGWLKKGNNNETAKCQACDITFKAKKSVIKKHSESGEHDTNLKKFKN